MKSLTFCASVLLALSSSFGPAAAFEGTVTMNLTAGKSTRPVTYFFKGDQLRYESQVEKGPPMVGLLDGKTGVMTVVMQDQKMYMTVGAPKAGLGRGSTFEETGRTEEVAGYKCSEYIVRDKKTVIEIWATTELGKMPNLAEAFANRGRRSAWEEFAAEKEIFALRVVTKDAKGRERSRLECTAVEKKSLDDALFKVPADFQQLKLPGLGDFLKP